MSNMAYRGEYEQAGGLAGFFEQNNLAAAESMEIKNDPRFFQDNIINYRLAAFGGCAVVSVLMIQNCMSEMWAMDKNMQLLTKQGKLFHPNGVLQLIAFTMLLMIFFFNMLSTYVGVAQPYHTIRLMTAGPTGFETAASYYLNRNIVAWRHMAIKYMLISLPMYISQMGIRLIVKFDRTNRQGLELPNDTPSESRIQGIIFSTVMLLLAMVLYHVNYKHCAIFQDRYESMARRVTGTDFSTYMNQMMTGRRNPHLDV
jgi:hypothetical protein